jgi:hypothetical protein
MMTDDVTGIALWDDDITDSLEDRLPIPDELRQRIKAWVNEFTNSIGGANAWGPR